MLEILYIKNNGWIYFLKSINCHIVWSAWTGMSGYAEKLCDNSAQRLVATRVFNVCLRHAVAIFKDISLVGSNQRNYFENANACRKRTLINASRNSALALFLLRDPRAIVNQSNAWVIHTFFLFNRPINHCDLERNFLISIKVLKRYHNLVKQARWLLIGHFWLLKQATFFRVSCNMNRL